MNTDIYNDISKRTGGDIYIGVVGPVRTGKSTFIKRFMESLVIPNITDDNIKERAKDELPQSSGGKTIMTTEPKFIPEDAVELCIDKASKLRVRMIDCVGYIVPSSEGYYEDDAPRMVTTPWSEEEIPFNLAAEIGTKKVIEEHSTIGLVVTTDGTITDIPRENYKEAEKRVIDELKEINKPFVILLNSRNPHGNEAQQLKKALEEEHGVPVLAVSCAELDEADIEKILETVLYEFPLCEIGINLPGWLDALQLSHPLKNEIYSSLRESLADVRKIREAKNATEKINKFEFAKNTKLEKIDLGAGIMRIEVSTPDNLFYKVLSDSTGFEIAGEDSLFETLKELRDIKHRYEKVEYALNEVEAKGYGIVCPGVDELSLEEPEIIKQGGRFGVKLRASAPSIHMIKANIETEVNPIVGSEKQSEELIEYLISGFDTDPKKIWESNIFGKSLHELVNEGLNQKLSRMPDESRFKLQETLQRIINDGGRGLICIIL